MVRHACGIFLPKHMSNVLTEPVTCEVKKRRWQMLGHIWRMNDLVSGKKGTIDAIKTKKENEENQISAYLSPSKMT